MRNSLYPVCATEQNASLRRMVTNNMSGPLPRLLLAAAVAVTLVLMSPVNGQKLPTRDEDHFQFHISHAEIFYDTKLLPDGAEVMSYLLRGVWRRFFFLVEDDDTPVSVVVTPCASAVDWRLSLHDLPEEASGSSPVRDQLFDQLEMTQTTPATPQVTILMTYSGREAQTFTMADCPAGVLMLELRTRDYDASVRMYATTTPHSDQAYPELPRDSQVHASAVTKHSVTLQWRESPTSSAHDQPVEYCVSINREANFRTQCAVAAYVFGDEPPTAPPNAGFGFAWERESSKELSTEEPLVGSPLPQRNDVDYMCVGSKLSYTFTNLRSDQQYYFDVFVVNLNSNRSTSYTGMSRKTHSYNKTITLKDGKVLEAFVKRSRGSQTFRFNPRNEEAEVVIVVQPCTGQLVVEVTRGGKSLARETVTSLWTVRVSDRAQGPYIIKTTPLRHRSVSFKLFASASKYPFPELADDTQIKVFEGERKCTSLTVAWLGTRRRLQYCLYGKHVPSTLPRVFREKNQCAAQNARKKSDKVMCKNFRYKNARRSVITETVRGLQPNSTYMFDVYVRRPGGETLQYQTAWGRTRNNC